MMVRGEIAEPRCEPADRKLVAAEASINHDGYCSFPPQC